MNVSGGFGNYIGFDEGDVVVMDVTHDVSCSSAEAVTQCVVQQIAGIQFQAGCEMQAKRVHVIATGADVVREERHHGVEGKGVGEEVLVAGVKIQAGDGRGIEG